MWLKYCIIFKKPIVLTVNTWLVFHIQQDNMCVNIYPIFRQRYMELSTNSLHSLADVQSHM